MKHRILLLILLQSVVCFSFASGKVKLDKELSDNLYTYMQDSLVGLADSAGNKLSDPVYFKVQHFYRNYAVVENLYRRDTFSLSEPDDYIVEEVVGGLLNIKTGKVITPVNIVSIKVESHYFEIRDSIGGYYVMDVDNGKFIYSYEPFILVREDSSCFLVNDKNEKVTGPYDEIFPFCNETGIALAHKGSMFYRINKQGEVIDNYQLLITMDTTRKTREFEAIRLGNFYFPIESIYHKCLPIDTSCLNVSYDLLYNCGLFFRDGFGINYTFLNSKYQISIPPVYDRLWYCKDHLFKAKKDNLFGLVSEKNTVLIPFKYDYISAVSHSDLFIVEKDSKYGLVNSKGKVISPTEYDNIEKVLCSDLFFVEKDHKFGLINSRGKIIQPIIYESLIPKYKQKESGGIVGFCFTKEGGANPNLACVDGITPVQLKKFKGRVDGKLYTISKSGKMKILSK